MKLSQLTDGLKGSTFKPFPFRDKNPLGGTVKMRMLYAPNDPMRLVHARFIRELRNLGFPLPYATGAKPGDSVRRNVMRHRHNRYFYLLDLRSAYLNVSHTRLTWVLAAVDPSLVGREKELYGFLEKFCIREGGLATGAPASPDLFNLYGGMLLDGAIVEICRKHGLTYTRYLDDLTFSSKRPIGKKKRRAIKEIVAQAGFEVSHRKAVVADLRKGPVKMNGVLLQWRGHDKPARMLLPRAYLRSIRGLIHVAMKPELDPAERARIVSRVHGMMSAFWQSADGGFNQTELKLLRQYRKLKMALAKTV